ncbi:MAG TPA: class I adenylate-forming enzyme family protein [Mycobacteriales bacterium]|nr:class I adenylate-forming enzyme family protein [Mycobacteriales bacterium]
MSFDLVEADVLGVPMTVFRERLRTMGELLDRSLLWADREYIVDGDRRLTYGDHHAAVSRVASYLVDQGVQKGDRVAIFGKNSIEWVVTFWATVSIGAIAVGLNVWWAKDELDYALADCEPKLLVDDMAPISALLDGADVQRPDVEIDEDDPALILYTSGTTGRPKGATHSHRNLNCLVQAQQCIIAARVPAGFTLPPSRALTSTPLFHVSGLHSGVIACLGAGNTTVWQGGKFDPVSTLKVIERERCTTWTTMPTTLWRVVHEPTAKSYDTSSLMHVGGGGAAWSAALQQAIRDTFGEHISWGIGYGQTEACGLSTTSTFAELQEHPDTVGRPVPTVELKVDEAGEIYLRGPMVMLGYWNNPAATDAVIDADRWLKTGDLGEIRDGLLYLSTRRTDLILRGAENVYPAEIENCLEGHPGVDEVVVVGLPDEEFGQVVGAVVVPAAGEDLGVDELSAYVKERLAYFKVPSRWVVSREPLPRTATGKVVRAEVMDRFEER